MDPKDERLPQPPQVINDLNNLPDSVPLPSGVTKGAAGSTGDWYAQKYTTRDGRTFYEFYKRAYKPPLPDGTYPPDPLVHTVQGATNTAQADRFNKEQEEAAKGPERAVVGGVLHERQPDGTWAPVLTTTGPAGAGAAAQSPGEARTAREEAEIARNAALPGPNPQGATEEERRGQDPRSETDAQRAARAETTRTAQGAAARQAQQDARQAQIDADARTRQQTQDARQKEIDDRTLATAKAAADAKNEPQVIYREIKNADGSTKNVQVRVYPGGREEVVPSTIPGQPAPREAIHVQRNPDTGELEEVYRDPVTGQAAVRPVTGQAGAGAKTPAPSLPQIVVGQSQDALRTAYDQIQQEVDSGRRTAAWGENRRKEVYDAAHLAVSEAQILEQSRQANQTTSFNVSNTVLNYGQSALENALKFTLQINDKLKPGSGSGGRMFAALFNMQMKMAKDSGIYDLGVPRGSSVGAGGPSSASGQSGAQTAQAPPKPRLTNPGDPAAVEADHQASRAQLEALEAAGGPRAYTPAMGGPQQSLPIRNGVPVTSTPALPATAAPAPPPGGPVVPPVPLPQPAAAPGAPPPAPMPAITPPPALSDPGFYRPDMQGTDTTDPGFYRPDMQGTDTTDPGFHRPLPGAQPQGSTALDALRAQFAPPPVQPLDPMGGMDPTTGGIPRLASSLGTLPPALQRAQIASMPPWRLPPQDLDALVEQHGPEAVFGWPGQHLLGGV